MKKERKYEQMKESIRITKIRDKLNENNRDIKEDNGNV